MLIHEETVTLHPGNIYVTCWIQLCHTVDSYVTLLHICSACLLDQIQDPTTPLLSKVKGGEEF